MSLRGERYSNLLLDTRVVCMLEEKEEDAAEVVGVHVRITKLISDCIEEEVPA